jgi:hypothetical protein
MGLADYSRTHIELQVLGSRATVRPPPRTAEVREVQLHVAVMHPKKEALDICSRARSRPPGTSWSPGTTGPGGRASVSPCIKQFAFLIKQRAGAHRS